MRRISDPTGADASGTTHLRCDGGYGISELLAELRGWQSEPGLESFKLVDAICDVDGQI